MVPPGVSGLETPTWIKDITSVYFSVYQRLLIPTWELTDYVLLPQKTLVFGPLLLPFLGPLPESGPFWVFLLRELLTEQCH